MMFKKLGLTDSVSAAKTSFHWLYICILIFILVHSLLVFYYIYISVKHLVTTVCEVLCK